MAFAPLLLFAAVLVWTCLPFFLLTRGRAGTVLIACQAVISAACVAVGYAAGGAERGGALAVLVCAPGGGIAALALLLRHAMRPRRKTTR
ncbi:hypothetical protein OG909_26900 [Streptomyces sp. NBC_01754]|uniref:hypothetical protein n=1 Tax=Streptomyces sp. NBC_01754 TaxID=2975930 RepID=UPI002DD996D3|nr:hypothetical protein [Streptomyces sp. NBC_01754]WSC95627.1 hypothetical protein OG909_26900 [Streptomyces sp. NBC_01754]